MDKPCKNCHKPLYWSHQENGWIHKSNHNVLCSMMHFNRAEVDIEETGE